MELKDDQRCNRCEYSAAQRWMPPYTQLHCLVSTPNDGSFRYEAWVWPDGWCPRFVHRQDWADWADKAAEWLQKNAFAVGKIIDEGSLAAKLREFAKEAKP